MVLRLAVPVIQLCETAAEESDVLVLQDALNALGYSTKTLDGAFGTVTNTKNALIAFQRNNGLTADGICGCCSWRRIVAESVGIGRTPTVIDP